MSNYKSYLLSQLGIRESSLKPAGIQPSDVDPKELEMGVEDETEHTNDPALAKKIALQHLKQHGDYYSRIKNAGLEEKAPPIFNSFISPTAVSTPVVAIAVRGSSSGGLPSGADRNMSATHVDGIDVSKMTRGQLGGYEAVPTSKDNSELIDKTPVNQQLASSSPKVDSPQTQMDPHPHQTQKAQGEAPQNVTGASDDGDSTLKLRMAMPKGIDVDVAEQNREEEVKSDDGNQDVNETFTRHKEFLKKKLDEGKHKAGCQCGFCKNKGKMGKKKDDTKPTEECKDCGCGDPDDKHLDEVNHTKNAKGDYVIAVGAPGSDARKECEKCPDCKCNPCDCDKKEKKPLNEAFARIGVLAGIAPLKEEAEQPEKDDETKTQVRKVQYIDPKTKTSREVDWISRKKNESYSAPFSRMRGLANLGERRVGSDGLWESENVGASKPFLTNWKMDKEKAGMVKIDEKKLDALMETLSKKTTLTEKEEKLAGLAKKLAAMKKDNK